MAVSDRIIVMKNAEIAQAGTPRDLYERPASSFIADFIGDANLLDVEVTATGEQTTVRLLGQDHVLPLASAEKGPAKLVLRPHQVRLTDGPLPGSVPAEVTYAAYLGNHVQYTLASAAGEIFAIQPPVANPFGRGDQVHVSWAAEDIRMVPA